MNPAISPHQKDNRPLCSRSLRKLLSVFAFVALAASALAQTATITGRVLNQGTGEYIKYAQIQAVGLDINAISEEGGRYTLSNVPAGKIKLAVSYTGLDPQEVTVTVPAQGSVTQDISLSAEDYGDVIKLGTFSVSGAREGNAKAIVEQREALNFKTVIASDAFGDVSEGNVGEFLRLLPGMSVDYVDNDVRTPRLRGLPAKYTTTTFDGHPFANAASSSITTGRQLELEQISINALEKLSVEKTPTSDMMTPNLSGNIDGSSKSAFSQKGRSIKYQASLALNQWNYDLSKSKGWDNKERSKALPGGQIEWIDTFLDGRLGIVMSVGQTGSYSEQRVIQGSFTWANGIQDNATETPNTTRWNFQHGLKPTVRNSFLLRTDYKFTDDLIFSVHTSYGYYDSVFHNRNWLINGNSDTATRTDVAADHTSSSATSTGNWAQVAGTNLRKSGGTFVVSPTIKWKFNNWKIDGGVSYSQAKNAYDSGDEGFFAIVQAQMNGVSWHHQHLNRRDVAITQLTNGTSNNNSFFDLSNYNQSGSVRLTSRSGKNQVWTANANAQIGFENWAMPTTFKFGAAHELNVLDIHTHDAVWNMALTGANGINLANYSDPFLGGVGTVYDNAGRNQKTPSTDKWKLFDLWKATANQDPFSSNASGAFTGQGANNLRNYLQNQFDIKETISSLYAMGTIKPVKKLTLVGGLRFEKTKSTGRSYDDIGNTRTVASTGITNTNDLGYIYARYGTRSARTRTYDNVLPSLQGKYNITRNLIVRAAYYKSLLRPDFDSLVGGLTVTGESGTDIDVTLRNTNLKPETADNFDVSVEYYTSGVGAVTFSAFHKQIKGIQMRSPALMLSQAPAGIRDQVLDIGYSQQQIDDPNSTYTTNLNGPDTSISGFETEFRRDLDFAFIPSYLKGFGVTVNFSYIKPKEDLIWPLIPSAGDGISHKLANFILRYKHNKFDAQVSANWTDEKLNALTGYNYNIISEQFTTAANAAQTHIADRVQINMNVTYKLHRRASLFMSVNNLLNAEQHRYQERDNFTIRDGNYGANITVGIKGQF